MSPSGKRQISENVITGIPCNNRFAFLEEESNPEASACTNVINEKIVSNLPIPISVSNPTESVLSHKDVPYVDCSHIQQSQEEEKVLQSLSNKALNETNKDTEETMEDSLNSPIESDTHDPSTVAMSRTSLESPLFHSKESPDVNLTYKAAEEDSFIETEQSCDAHNETETPIDSPCEESDGEGQDESSQILKAESSPSDDELRDFLRDSYRKRNIELKDHFPDLSVLIIKLKKIVHNPVTSNFTEAQKHRLKKKKDPDIVQRPAHEKGPKT